MDRSPSSSVAGTFVPEPLHTDVALAGAAASDTADAEVVGGGRRPSGRGPSRPEPLGQGRRPDWVVAAATGVGFLVLAAVFREYLYRPFWYDEIWRAHFVSEPFSTFWPELEQANTPSALGWMTLTRASGAAFGWHSWSLRLPGFVALPLLASAVVLLTRRFAGRLAAVFAAVWVCGGATFLDLGTQLKPYTVETLAAVCAVLLWTGGPAVAATGRRARQHRVVRRTGAGCLALFAVPLVFVVVPLAAVDVWRAGGRHRVAAAVEAVPALAVAGLHTLLFLGHQSSQRQGTYWDAHFLAGRGVLDGIGFVARELGRTFTGTPPGIDRYDPSLIHPPTDGAWLTLLTGPVVAFAFVVGAVVLLRRSGTASPTIGGAPSNSTAPSGGYVDGGYVDGGYVVGGYVVGGYVVGTLAVAHLLVLAASLGRYWPIGPVRTNLFLVPLFVVVTVAGAERTARYLVAAAGRSSAGRSLAGHGPARRVVAVACLVALAGTGLTVQAASADGLGLLWERRDRARGLDQTVDAAVAVRRLFRPGDVVVVGGRLMRPGWIYAMEVSDDSPVAARDLPALPPGASGEAPRVPRSATTFVQMTGDGSVAAAVRDAGKPPGRVLVFVFELDLAGFEADLAQLRGYGWCGAESWHFDLAGTVTVLETCPAA